MASLEDGGGAVGGENGREARVGAGREEENMR